MKRRLLKLVLLPLCWTLPSCKSAESCIAVGPGKPQISESQAFDIAFVTVKDEIDQWLGYRWYSCESQGHLYVHFTPDPGSIFDSVTAVVCPDGYVYLLHSGLNPVPPDR